MRRASKSSDRVAWLLVTLSTFWSVRATPADFVPYAVRTEERPFEPLSESATRVEPGLGDGETFRIDLPFDFSLYGVPHRAVFVNANGFIAMSPIEAQAPVHVPPSRTPMTSSPRGFVAPLWADWCASATGSGQCASPANPEESVRYAFGGSPGRRFLTIEWRQVRLYPHDDVPSAVDFQATLHEGPSSRIDFDYGPFIEGRARTGSPDIVARMGIEASDEQKGLWVGPCAGPSACTAADLATLPNHRVTLVADAGPDLRMLEVHAPTVGHRGQSLAVTPVLVNQHAQASSALWLSIHLIPEACAYAFGDAYADAQATRSSSADLNPDPTEASSGSVTACGSSAPFEIGDGSMVHGLPVDPLGPFETRAIPVNVSLLASLPAGLYRIAAYIEGIDQGDEIDLGNNIGVAPSPVSVREPAPDLSVLGVASRSRTAAPGDSIDVEFRVGNAGYLAGAAEILVVLSPNPFIGPTDRVVGWAPPVLLAPDEDMSGLVTALVPLDLAAGEYFVGAVVNPPEVFGTRTRASGSATETLSPTPELSLANNIAVASEPVLIETGELALLTTSLPPATVGEDYVASLRATGGSGSFSFFVLDGRCPSGLEVAVSGAIVGIPREAGVFPVHLSVTSGGMSSDRWLELEVRDRREPLVLVSRLLPAAIVGRAYEVELQAAGGGPPYSFALVGGTLPAGLCLNPQGLVDGVPRESGLWAFDVALSDARGGRTVSHYELDIRQGGSLMITSADLGQVLLGEATTLVLHAEGARGRLRWRSVPAAEWLSAEVSSRVSSHDLPIGLEITSEGLVLGRPEAVGPTSFLVEASDDSGGLDRGLVRLEVLEDAALRVDAGGLLAGAPGTSLRATVSVSGGEAPYAWHVLDDHKPPGFLLRPAIANDGALLVSTSAGAAFIIEGILEREGFWSVTLEVRDSRNRRAVRSIAIIARDRDPRDGDDSSPSTPGGPTASGASGAADAAGASEHSCACDASRTTEDAGSLFVVLLLLLAGLSLRLLRQVGACGRVARRGNRPT